VRDPLFYSEEVDNERGNQLEIEKEHSYRFAKEIIDSTPELSKLFGELLKAISSITDEDLISVQQKKYKGQKSISKSINFLLRERLVELDWTKESKIFKGEEYRKENSWALDFAKSMKIESLELMPSQQDRQASEIGIAVEVAFNHGEAAAWNILKPVLAAELNHVEKETSIGEGIGVLIVVSASMEDKGGFDGAVGNYERYMKHLKVMRNQLTVPMMLLALDAPKTFYIERYPKNHPVKNLRGRSMGTIVPIKIS
jgi:hypothetical protein